MVKVHAVQDESIDVQNAASVDKDALRQSERDKAKQPGGLAWRKYGRQFLATWSSTVQDAVGLTGIKYLVNNQSSQLRRFVWTLAILLGSLAVIYQMQERYALFASVAKSVDFEIVYPTSLVFPAVTICNFNTYRNLNLDQEPFGKILEDFNNFDMFGAVNFSSYEPQLRGVNLTNLTLHYGHLMTNGNMFITGVWGHSGIISPDNFSSVLTDSGLCYTFNGGENGTPPLTVNSAGKGNGLSLLLNLEQDYYYYSAATPISAGFLVAVHEQGKVPPLMRSVGISVPPGTEARISIRKKQIKNIGNTGDCGTKELKYFSSYTSINCRRECEAQVVLDKCGCVLPFEAGETLSKIGFVGCTVQCSDDS
ncbi:acid-sensing ion channel 1-like [Asterias amurensis]|uniref:acid-sensing ion channel 1-like n=1 Tax=Asterias amurensis TaxID=7602 RepID=UPI003AB4152D